MTRLSDLIETMYIKDDVLCMGEVWHNERMKMLVDGVKSNKFNIELVQWVKEVISEPDKTITMHSSDRLTKTQIKKLNAIMKAKSKATLQKRVLALSGLFTGSMCQAIFEQHRNESWVKFCNEHKLEHGLTKVNRHEQFQKELNALLQSY